MRRPPLSAAPDVPGRGPDIVPLYHRVYVILLQKMSDGSFPSGESMPSEDELAESFGVSRVTIRKAMDRLEREGLVLRQRGRGTFPVPRAKQSQEAESRLMRNQISLAQKTKVTVLDYGFVRVPPQLVHALGSAPGADVLRIVRVRHDARSPISHTVCYLSANVAGLVPKRQISSLPISATLTAAGVKLTRFHERITATLADSDIARHLQVDVGTALIAMTRRVEGENGQVVELLQALYRPDRYEYRVEYSGDEENAGAPWAAMITDSRT